MPQLHWCYALFVRSVRACVFSDSIECQVASASGGRPLSEADLGFALALVGHITKALGCAAAPARASRVRGVACFLCDLQS